MEFIRTRNRYQMEILKIVTEWTKAEIFSSKFFIFFALLFLSSSAGFWQLGKNEVSRAFIFPTLVAGALLMTIGIGLVISNKSRLSNIEQAYNEDARGFINSEIERAEDTMKEYQTVVFKAIPVIIVVASLLIVFLSGPIWRAICITIIAMLVVLLFVDSNAHERIKNYKAQLELWQEHQ